MPPRRVTWRRLLPGLAALGALLAGAIGIIAFARVGSLHGDTYRFRIIAGDAGGVMKGTQVWIAGRRVGLVRGVGFRSTLADTLGRLAVDVEVLRRYQPEIRHDSRVSFENGGTPIGAVVVAIGVGSAGSPVVAPGDTIRALPPFDRDSLRAQIGRATKQIPAMLGNLRTMSAGLQRAAQLLDTTREDGSPTIMEVAGDVERLQARAADGRGTIPRLLHDRALAARARRTAAAAESLLAATRGGTGTVGRLATDSALILRLAAVRAEIGTVQRALAEERGTAGRLAHDSALERDLGRLQRGLDSTIADAKRRPGAYLGF